jgi:hypothetical protein
MSLVTIQEQEWGTGASPERIEEACGLGKFYPNPEVAMAA